jgi:hypothetical protein
MTQLIAVLALCVIALGLQLGNYWYTFGLWPVSWTSFVCFAVASLIVSAALTAVMKSDT